ncbi:probable non-inhibitory serpin-Z5 [Eutrema salsugineum]|uniref:probable non-inhibitory serpin-Z5 n=1 Tax=Eutrema salsugineum TaxID=72664 RepID=UPI000CED7595|nr:probable non-inhibitory serpin-Z5 [Eutrema salsugineum]
MDPKKSEQKLSTSSDTADPSLSNMYRKEKENQKLSKSQEVIASPTFAEIKLPRAIDVEDAMKKQNDFTMFLTAKVISSVAKNSNVVFSPTSINAVLTMSSSIDELNAVFCKIATVVLADASASGGPKISAVNGVWMEQSLPVKPSLKDLFENFFKAAFAQVDFRFKAEQVREEVNAWASNHTNGLIKDILPRGSIKSDTDWIYGNALYFKGAWEDKFPKSLTRDDEFQLLNGTSVSVPFMSSCKKQYVTAYDGFKVLRLPYQQGRDDTNRKFSMYFYLPDKIDGLDNLLERMTSTDGFLVNYITTSAVKVGKLRIPKIKIEFGFEASKIFDLRLQVSLYQKALIEIDEDGAVAAAVTKGGRRGCRGTIIVPKTIDFVADHPFLFLIREDKTGTVLFTGQILDPSKSSPT